MISNKHSNTIRIAIIGGGAAGMMAAITATENHAKVTLFEKNDRVGKKILATGNGKCNLSNLDFSVAQYYCKAPAKLQKIFEKFSVQDTIQFFQEKGLMIRDKNQYLYPYSEQASAVQDTLRKYLNQVEVITDAEIVQIDHRNDKQNFEVKDQAGCCYYYDKVILACGSPASLKKGEGMTGYKLAAQAGHQINKLMPGLVSLQSNDSFIKALAGVRSQAHISLWINSQKVAEEQGELQFTDYGISGIPVFQISRLVSEAIHQDKNAKMRVNIDFFPEISNEAYQEFVKKRFNNLQEDNLEQFLSGTVNKKINIVMMKQVDLKPNKLVKEIGLKSILSLMQLYKNFVINITGPNTLDKAQICAGGVDFAQVTESMESTIRSGLYFAGEIVDIDGKCGGYNLQWAWSSGYIAGKSASEINGTGKARTIC